MIRWIVSAILVSLALPSFAAAAVPVARKAEIVGIRVGFADRYKVGLWTPVTVRIAGGSEAIEGRVIVTVPDGDGVPTRVATDPAIPCRVPAGGEAEAQLYVRFGRVYSTLRAELRVDDVVAAEKLFTVSEKVDDSHFLPAIEQQRLIVALGGDAMGIEEAISLEGLEANRRPVVARLDSALTLPTRWCGYEGVDTMVISTSKGDMFQGVTEGSATVVAIREWVEQGGGLLVCGSPGAESLIGPGRPLAELVPGKFADVVGFKQTAGLEEYCRSTTPVPRLGGTGSGVPVAVRLTAVDGKIESQEGNLPLIVHAARGFGSTTFFAAALDQPPFAPWPDRGLLVARLLDLPTSHGDDAHEGGAVMHFGYADIAGQLRSALDRFEGVGSAPFWLVAGAIIVYILLIGPVDYLVLRRLGGRMQWTWVTFPLVVLLFCVAAAVMANRLRGDAVRIHQVDLVDMDLAASRLRGTTWFNIFSPEPAAFDLAVRPRLPDGRNADGAVSLVTWMGLPGSALGGMNPKAAEASPWSAGYEFTPALDQIHGAPITAGATKSFTARWTAPLPPSVEAELNLENDQPTGMIVNNLGVPLSKPVLAYRHWVFELEDIGPGQTATVGPRTRRSEISTLLTGRKLVLDPGKTQKTQVSTPYDRESVDPVYILRMMTFFDAVGGQRYTELTDDYQRFVNFSHLLRTDRAVLFAAGPAGEAAATRRTEVLRDGKPLDDPNHEYAVLYRIVIPVRTQQQP